MKSYTETEPFFSDTIKITEVTDPGHADLVNEAPKQLLKNTIVNKNEIDKLKEESAEYLPKTGDSSDNIVTFESDDNKNATSWTDVPVMESKEKHKSLLAKVSTMFKNVRFLYKILGSEDISQVGDGTVTGILQALTQVALTGSYNDLKDQPNELPASDVYSWAKQTTKPEYSKSEVGLGSVDNTSDIDKPVSTAQQTALGKKVNIASILESIEQVDANTTAKNIVDALVIKALKANLTNSINQISSNLLGQTPFDIYLRRNYDRSTANGIWQNICQWRDNNGRVGYLAEYIIDGNVQLYITNEYGDIFINNNSITDIVNNINDLKNNRTWNCILSTQTGGTCEIQELSGTEVLLTYGYVYRMEKTMLIPIDIFAQARGEGARILLNSLTIEVLDDTHINVGGIESGYLFRLFVR